MGNENSTPERARRVMDNIKAFMIASSFILILVLLAAFYYICWQVLSSKPHSFVTAWALIATTLVFIGTLTGAAIGLYAGIKQSDVVLRGVELAVDKVIHAAEQVSEVRVMTLSKYQSTPERKGGQEWMIDKDLFGVLPHNTSAPSDMPSDSTGRPGE